MTLGEIIKKRRKELDLTQTQLATTLGFSGKSAVSQIENDIIVVNYKQLKTIMNVLKLSPDQIFGLEKLNTKNKLDTKYGEVTVVENEDNSITITYNTDKNVLVDMRSSNRIRFITVEPYTNKILTK